MQFQIDGPTSMEAVKIEVTKTSMTVVPLTVRGQHIVRACYVTAKGSGGTEAKAVLLFNGNTGEFSLQRLDADPVPFAFDKAPDEFNARRETIKKQKRAANAARASTANVPEGSNEKTG